jgi:hydrogenase expression/formation protein HypD
MKYIDEFRDPDLARRLLDEIAGITTKKWAIMELCGGQTHSIIRTGIDQLLPDAVELIHGPGCPVCVTPIGIIDQALRIAALPDVIFCSFGDMLRVPGSQDDLFAVRSRGGDVRVVYSPLDAVDVAEANPDKDVVFFAVGFETTAPANALAVDQAKTRGLDNFSVLVSHVMVPPAIEAIAGSPDNRVDGFLAAGHVCTVMGTWQYGPLVERFNKPIVVTGFEPLDLLEGIRRIVLQLEEGRAELENAYERMVTSPGNLIAQELISRVFEVCDRQWRGIGEISDSGWRLTDEYRQFDAQSRFDVGEEHAVESPECRAGEVLQGLIKPIECEAFGTTCTPRNPLGATMVSSEGACAAYYQYRRIEASVEVT